MSRLGWLCAPLLTVAAASAAAAGDEGRAEQFARLDADGDGRLQVEEVRSQGALSSHFPLADADGDGSLDAAEFSAFEEALEEMSRPAPGGPPGGQRM